MPTHMSYLLSLHDALPIWTRSGTQTPHRARREHRGEREEHEAAVGERSVVARLRCRRARGAHGDPGFAGHARSEEHTSELQSLRHLVCRLLLEKKKEPPKSRRRHRRDRLTQSRRMSTSPQESDSATNSRPTATHLWRRYGSAHTDTNQRKPTYK